MDQHQPRYREDKTTQAAGYLLQRRGGSMSHMKLIKLLYLADREALIRWGRPITFDSYFSLPHGPVLSFTLNKINDDPSPTNPSYWHNYISRREVHEVSLNREPPIDQLSSAEKKLLQEIFDEFGELSRWEIVDLSHKLPEWTDPQGSHLRITIADILQTAGFSEQDIREIEDILSAEASAEQALG